jgi:hypothetical protein
MTIELAVAATIARLAAVADRHTVMVEGSSVAATHRQQRAHVDGRRQQGPQ